MSNTYLRSIEKGVDPRTGGTIIPSPEVLKKLAGPLNEDYITLLKIAGHLDEKEIETISWAQNQIVNIFKMKQDLEQGKDVIEGVLQLEKWLIGGEIAFKGVRLKWSQRKKIYKLLSEMTQNNNVDQDADEDPISNPMMDDNN
ncbi:hypothetical protein [Paenibacillus sp. 598K]|uniref:hypothetical protein n=1 Tax=Paenibacillus sp. 598K TaxID=1117987 RepID=UPI0035E3EC95